MEAESTSFVERARSGHYIVHIIVIINTWIVYGEFRGDGKETDSLLGVVHFGALRSVVNGSLMIRENKLVLNIEHHHFEIIEIEGFGVICKYGGAPADLRIFTTKM